MKKLYIARKFKSINCETLLSNSILIIFRIWVLIGIMIACHSNNPKASESNEPTEKFNTVEKFPNHKIAFEKKDNWVFLYNPAGEKLFTIDLKKSMYVAHQPELSYSFYLSKINDFLYFAPKITEVSYTFATGNVGTGMGVFSTKNTINDLGLFDNIKIEYPNENGKMEVNNVAYSYNKFTQLLKVKQNRDIILEHKYDENANIIETKTSKEQHKFTYNTEGYIVKEEITNKESLKNILNYRYTPSKQIEKKYNDDETLVKEYQYDSNNQLVSVIEYSGIVDKNDPNEMINHFIKKDYTYNKDQIILEKYSEYTIKNVSVWVKDRWKPITITEQKKLAWRKFKDQSDKPLLAVDKKYSYRFDEIDVEISKYGFSTSLTKGKAHENKELLDAEIIRYKMDNMGRVIKKEIFNRNEELKETMKFYY